GVGGRIVGKHPDQEQRHVAEPAVHAGPLGLRDRLKQARQPRRVELAEPPGPRPPACPGPVTAAGDPREGGEELGQEQPAGRRSHAAPPAGPAPQLPWPPSAGVAATEASSLRSASVRWLAYSRPASNRSMTPRYAVIARMAPAAPAAWRRAPVERRAPARVA